MVQESDYIQEQQKKDGKPPVKTFKCVMDEVTTALFKKEKEDRDDNWV